MLGDGGPHYIPYTAIQGLYFSGNTTKYQPQNTRTSSSKPSARGKEN